ncbi:basic proline-rich protein-like [Penaeus chinensis]|uniref:basic proline-rich protein-like n=1 Tax=Penaeus chinensis TaxID=139456 RepID=UPI001FB79B53|nr:basic proline-rich protein-like [Penaeus chinensis]XP_047496875.1 basic proline-rich protein-like [Penaeus chinensis]XP_047496876.1 basic proline-rich protein-like [Penaeus chinensis]
MTKPPTPAPRLRIAWASFLLLLLVHAPAGDCHARTPVSGAASRTRRNVLEAPATDAGRASLEARGAVSRPNSPAAHEDFPSSGASVPNSWLYKFPPWFLPNNPAPEGFAKHQIPPPSVGPLLKGPQPPHSGGPPTHFSEGPPIPSAGGPKALSPGSSFRIPADPGASLPEVLDGDVVIVSDLQQGTRTGRLQNIRLRGDSEFKEELLRTILEAKLLNKEVPLQTSTPSDLEAPAGVTPFQLPLSAAPPPPPRPAPTQPFVLQDLAGGGDSPAVHGFGGATSSKSGVGKSATGGRLGGGGPVRTPFAVPPTPATHHAEGGLGEFRPSPPDLTSANRSPPRSFLQASPSLPLQQAPPHDLNLRPPPTISAPQPRPPQPRPPQPRPPQPRPPQRGLGGAPFPRPGVEHNAIADAFFKDQEEALLKAANGAKVRGVHGAADDPVWIPFIPGFPLPILVQHSLAARRKQKAQRTRSLGNQPPAPSLSFPPSSAHAARRPSAALAHPPVGPGEASYPTSIQDILNSRLGASQELYPRARPRPFPPGVSASSSGETDLGLLAWARS